MAERLVIAIGAVSELSDSKGVTSTSTMTVALRLDVEVVAGQVQGRALG